MTDHRAEGVVNHYSQGLRHGYEDAYEAIRKILAEDISGAEKLERIGWQVAPPTAVNSTTYTCPGCGVTVIGHETCGDPTRPGCVTESTHSDAAGNGVPQLPDSDNDTSQDQGGC